MQELGTLQIQDLRIFVKWCPMFYYDYIYPI